MGIKKGQYRWSHDESLQRNWLTKVIGGIILILSFSYQMDDLWYASSKLKPLFYISFNQSLICYLIILLTLCNS